MGPGVSCSMERESCLGAVQLKIAECLQRVRLRKGEQCSLMAAYFCSLEMVSVCTLPSSMTLLIL